MMTALSLKAGASSGYRQIALLAVAVAAVAIVPNLGLGAYERNILLQVITYAIAVTGLVVVIGNCGQISLAQAAFFAIGAYAVALGTVEYGLSFWLSLALGLAVAAIAGIVLGVLALRLASHYLAMVTISFQLIVTLVLTNWISFSRGPDGIGNIPRPALFADAEAYLALCLTTLFAVGYLVHWLLSSRLGRAMRAVRDNELAAGTAGIDVLATKVAAFVLSAVFAALGGGLFAGGFSYVSPEQFSFVESILFMTMGMLGGITSPIGAGIGASLLILIPEWLRFLKEIPGLYLAIYGCAVLVIILFMPEGIWGYVSEKFNLARPRVPDAAKTRTLGLRDGNRVAGPILATRDAKKHFGGVKAVDGVDLSVERGRVHALIGPNGSGKTTLLNVLSSLYDVTGGSVYLNDTDVTRHSPHRKARAGLGRTFQNIRLFRSMSALENVQITAEQASDAKNSAERAQEALEFVGLGARSHENAGSFSYGHQRLIEIARALAGNPDIILLDEPAAGLNLSEKRDLSELLKRISRTKVTILIIDHDMSLVSDVADHITVLNFGRKIAEGAPDEVLRHPEVIKAYLGAEIDAVA